MIKKITFLLFILCFQCVFSQIENLIVDPSNIDKRTSFNRMTASPEVAAFQKISFLPINLYTGKPDIDIALYTIKTGEIEVPISLKYDIGGNKVDDIASNAGWGWSLNAGGNVTRVIRDIDDHEYDGVFEITPCTNNGTCDDLDLQNNGFKLLQLGYLRRLEDVDNPPSFYLTNYLSNFSEDALPDLFLVNAPGLSTKFHMERDFSNYNEAQFYTPKILDGSLSKIEKTKYMNFDVTPIINYSSFNQDDATPNIYTNPPLAYNLSNFIRGFSGIPGLVSIKSKDYVDFNITNDKGIKFKFSSFDINESAPAFYGDVNFYNGIGHHGRPMDRHFGKMYKVNKSAWHLNQIKNNNKEVNFYYKPAYQFDYEIIENYTGNVTMPITGVDKISSILDSGTYFNVISSTGIYIPNGPLANPTSLELYNLGNPVQKSEYLTKTTQQQILDKIIWDEGEVLFYYDTLRKDRPSSKALSEVKIINKSGAVIKHYKFVYSYFNSSDSTCPPNNTDSKCYRLKLDEIHVNNKDAQKISNYIFNYNDENNVPKLYSLSKDFLGYYNAEPNIVQTDKFQQYIKEYHFRPKFTFTPNKGRFSILPFQNNLLDNNSFVKIDGQGNINANNFSQIGLLNEIIYPTGGNSKFVYENNKFNLFDKDLISGGSRIKNQSIDDGKGNIISKIYEYITTEGKSSGTIINFPKIADILLWNSTNKNFSFQTYNYSKSNIELTQGSYVGYSRIIEKINENGGQTEYIFNSSNEYPNEYESPGTSFFSKNSFYPGRAYVDNDNRRGTLKNKYIYDSNGIKLVEENYNYTNYKILDSRIRNFSVATKLKGMTGYFYTGKENFSIKIVNSINRLGAKERIEYFNGIPLRTRLDYQYLSNKHPYVTEQITTNSDGSVYTKKISRVQDLPNQGVFESMMIAKNMLDIPLGELILKNDNKYTDNRVLYFPADPMPEELTTRYLPKHSFSNTGPSNLDISPTSLDRKSTVDIYDDKSNIVQYTSEDDIPVTLIWGYNKTQIIAQIKGAELYNINSTLINNIISKSDVDNLEGTIQSEQLLFEALESFRKDLSLNDFRITTYIYDPLIGVKSITPPSGLRELYKYDAANRLEKVVDVNGNILKEYKYNYKD